MPERPDGGRSRPPLQNRVDPAGALHAVPERGRMMGNRGGRFHSDGQTLGARRWASRQWIACVCAFKQRKRQVWGNGYTELFFLDEATALSAGHRPCFECRRQDALRFARAFAAPGPRSQRRRDGRNSPPRAIGGPRKARLSAPTSPTCPTARSFATEAALSCCGPARCIPGVFPATARPRPRRRNRRSTC